MGISSQQGTDTTSVQPAPVTSAERIAVVDVLRGFAIFGILLVNMELFNTPFQAQLINAEWHPGLANEIASFAILLLAAGKFYTLFSFLFGLGMALQMRRLEQRAVRFGRLYARRLLVLLLIGVAHVVFFWFGDILTIYALLGFPLLLFRKRRTVTVMIVAIIVYVLPLLFIGSCAGFLELAAMDPTANAEIEKSFAEQEAFFAAGAEVSEDVYSGGSYGEIVRQRLEDYQASLFGMTVIGPGIFAMFLLGLVVGRVGILHKPEAHRRLFKWLIALGCTVGLACNVAFAISQMQSNWIRPDWEMLADFTFYLAGVPLLTFAYASMLVLLWWHDRWRPLLTPLAYVGRMALTNYLLQTVVCTTLFYSYGFGLFGQVGPALGLLLTVAIYGAQIPLSVWWLRRYRFGPMEWIWRSLTYGRWQPMRARTA